MIELVSACITISISKGLEMASVIDKESTVKVTSSSTGVEIVTLVSLTVSAVVIEKIKSHIFLLMFINKKLTENKFYTSEK